MVIPEILVSFLGHVKNISIAGHEINFLTNENLVNGQVGYASDQNGKSLVNGKEDGWQNEWMVIANDQLGDPVFIDTNDEMFTVLTAQQGEDTWEPIVIADSLSSFSEIILLINELADKLSGTQIQDADRQKLLHKIIKRNPETIIWFWEDFLDENL